MTTNSINTSFPIGNLQGGTGATIPTQNIYTLAYAGVSGFPITSVSTPAYLEYTLGTNLAALLAAGGSGYLSANLSGISFLAANLASGDGLSFYLGTNQTTSSANASTLTTASILAAGVISVPNLMRSISSLSPSSPTTLRLYVSATALGGISPSLTVMSYSAPLQVSVRLQDS